MRSLLHGPNCDAVQVGCEYCLQQETLFLATALLDRFLTNSKVRVTSMPQGLQAAQRGAGVTDGEHAFAGATEEQAAACERRLYADCRQA